jgi:hypothetical protein
MEQTDFSNRSSAPRDQIDDQYDERNNQQKMYVSTQRIGTDQSQEPEDQEHDENCPKHSGRPLFPNEELVQENICIKSI